MSRLGTLARDALRRSITAAMQAGGTRRPPQAEVDRITAYAVDQVEHAMILDRAAGETRAQDPHA